jgi:hypothetical protein
MLLGINWSRIKKEKDKKANQKPGAQLFKMVKT